MRHEKFLACGAAALVALTASLAVGATNSVPWNDAFEGYDHAFQIAGTNGWTADNTGDAVVITNGAAVSSLTNYAVGGRTFPLPAATHERVVVLANQVRNDIRSASGGVVTLDLMALPEPVAERPVGDPGQQYVVCLTTNGHVLLWHRNMTGGVPGTNEWLELSHPPLTTGVWTRFTIVHDYGHQLFQVSVNEGAPLTDPAGWTAGGESRPGSWFHMVQTNGLLSKLRFGTEGTNYLDDVNVVRRTVVWSGTGFTERAINDGRVDTGTTVGVTLQAGNFAGTNGEDLVASGKAVVGGLPQGLTGVVSVVSATQAVVRLDGVTVAHESSNSVSGIGVQLLDGAFELGNASDVVGNPSGGLSLTFYDTPSLTWSGTAFYESAVNDGHVDNTSPVTITLAHGTLTGSNGEDFGADTSKLVVTGLPTGLGAAVVRQSATELQLTLSGVAGAHAAADSASVSLVFQDGAFNTVPASSVYHASTNITVTFVDNGVLMYGATVFAETATNNGTVNGTTLTLTNKTFNGTVGENLVASGKVTPSNVPAGLTVVVTLTGSQSATVGFSGAADAHAALNSIANLGLTFGDSAFAGGNAAAVDNAGRNDLSVAFADPPLLSVAGAVFTEAAANNGTIGNSVTITLAGETFAGGTYTQGEQFTVANVPDGLTAEVSASGSEATLSLTGTAAVHSAVASIANLSLSFLEGAFTTVAASNVSGQPLVFSVTFADQAALAYSGTAFTEQAGGVIDNRTPITVTLSGDTFSGADGSDLAGAGLLVVGNLPAGLTAAAVKTSGTTLGLTLSGVALANASSNSVSDVMLTFQEGAFANSQANQVRGYATNGFSVTFLDDMGFFNVMPYEEPFEAYANGTKIAGTNGWSGRYPHAGIVTNAPAVVAIEPDYLAKHMEFPVVGSHLQVLGVEDGIQTEVHTEGAPLAYLDFMMVPVPLEYTPDDSLNRQYAFYVSTNLQVVIWHRDMTGGAPGVPGWLTLTNTPAVSTSQWTRFTVAQDYVRHRFQLRINEGLPITDGRGWNDAGTGHPGSWFHMVQTNVSLSRIIFSGLGEAYVDDVTVRETLPENFAGPRGVVFTIR